MSLLVFTGRPRSGKTIEVVKEVILAALASGRRVVTNVSGLDRDAIVAYLVEKRDIDLEKVGQILTVDRSQIEAPGFFPIFDDHHKVITKPGIVQGGDVVVCDEVWRYWSPDHKISAEHMQFFRLHGQIADATTGLACEIIIITQDIVDLNRKIKVIVEKTYRTTKLGKFGTPKNYRLDVFGGYKCAERVRPLESMVRKYDRDMFGLYASTSHKDGQSQQVDRRGNVLNSALYKIVLPVGLLISIASGKYVWDFLHGEKFGQPKPPTAQTKEGGAGPIGTAPPQTSGIKGVSEVWRVAGWTVTGSTLLVQLVDGAGRSRVVAPPAWNLKQGGFSVALPEGGVATEFSGPAVLRLAQNAPQGNGGHK